MTKLNVQDLEALLFPEEVAENISDDQAAILVDRYLSYSERLDRCKKQYEAIRSQIEEEKRIFEDSYMTVLQEWFETNRPEKSKSIKLVSGVLSSRTTPGGLKETDKEALRVWAHEVLPEAIVVNVTENVALTMVKEYAKRNHIVPAGMTHIPARETFYIKPPEGRMNLDAVDTHRGDDG